MQKGRMNTKSQIKQILGNINYKPLISYRDGIKQKLMETEYARNVFLMMKFRDENKKISDVILRALKKKGLNGVRADMKEWSITDDTYNSIAVSYCCKYGIALFDEPEKGQLYNPNVCYELGFIHADDKPCLIIINNQILKKKPFDLISRIHKSYSDRLQIEDLVIDWIQELGLKKKLKTNQKPLKVSVGIVQRNNCFLITQRKQTQGSLEWSFPTGIIKPHETPRSAIERECYDETNIKIKAKYEMGRRLHPDTNVFAHYYFCDYTDGKIRIRQPHELKKAKWVTAQEAKRLITSNLYQPVKQLLNHAKK
ncbi:NUDIX hydrolase [bacterium]|nr:MAG: NUDIX hydrolase [bacterium]